MLLVYILWQHARHSCEFGLIALAQIPCSCFCHNGSVQHTPSRLWVDLGSPGPMFIVSRNNWRLCFWHWCLFVLAMLDQPINSQNWISWAGLDSVFYLNEYGMSQITLASYTVFLIAAKQVCRKWLVSAVSLLCQCTCHPLSCGCGFIDKILVWWSPACIPCVALM